MAKTIVEKTNVTRVLYGRSSIQGIIKELSDQRTFPNGYVLNTASGFIVSGELASSLVDDPQAQTILTDLYDSNYHTSWTNTLKGSGKEKLQEIYVTFLAATNPTLLDEFLEDSSIQGGFIARTLLIKEDRKARLNPLIGDNDDAETLEFDSKDIIDKLKEIASARGQFKFDSDARDRYIAWYKEFNEKLEGGYIKDSTGTSDRLHDHVLKVAMLLSLASKPDLIINDSHVLEAINLCTGDAVRVAEGVAVSKGKSDLAGQTKIFLDELLGERGNAYTLSRKEILQRRYQDFDAFELDKIVETMTQANVVKLRRAGEDVYYTLEARYVGEIERMLRK